MTRTATLERAPAAPFRAVADGLLAGGVAAIANLVILLVVTAAGARPLVVPGFGGADAMTIGVGAVVAASLVPALIAAALLALLTRLGRRGPSSLRAIAVAALLLTLVPPLGLDVTIATKASLVAMHLAAAVTIVGTLTWRARRAGGVVRRG